MTDEGLSPAAALDEEHYLASVAADLAKATTPARSPARSPHVTHKDLDRLVETIAKAVRELVVEPLHKRIAELEARQLKMAGTYKAGERYAESSLVTFQGGLWLALAPTDTKPGSGPAWRMCVKSGDLRK